MLESIKYVIALYMSKNKGQTDINCILKMAENVARIYNVNYDEYGFSVMENGKEKTKILRYTQKNIGKIFMLNPCSITQVYFECYKKEDKDFLDSRFSLGILVSDKEDCPNQITLIIDPMQMSEKFNKDSMINLIRNTDELIFKLEYGVAFVMETNKRPVFFVIGTQTSNLNEEEKKVASSLCLNLRQYQSKIWDIFWFNIIKKDLILEDMLNDIMEILPKESIVDIGDKYIISLPLQYDEYISDKEKLYTYKQKLRQIFKEKDLIMYQG